MSLEVTHNGFTLTYSDNEDKWEVWSLKLEDKSLAKLKQKVNTYVANKIKTANLIVGITSEYGSQVPSRKQVVSRDAKTGEYWVKDLEDDRRERVKAEKLFPWTPEIDQQVEAYLELRRQVSDLSRQANETLKTLTKPGKDAVALMLLDLSKAPEEE
jgi:hypothetical protein